MSAGRNLMEWKTRRREVPKWLEPSLSDAALAEEEGLDRIEYSCSIINPNSLKYDILCSLVNC